MDMEMEMEKEMEEKKRWTWTWTWTHTFHDQDISCFAWPRGTKQVAWALESSASLRFILGSDSRSIIVARKGIHA